MELGSGSLPLRLKEMDTGLRPDSIDISKQTTATQVSLSILTPHGSTDPRSRFIVLRVIYFSLRGGRVVYRLCPTSSTSGQCWPNYIGPKRGKKQNLSNLLLFPESGVVWNVRGTSDLLCCGPGFNSRSCLLDHISLQCYPQFAVVMSSVTDCYR